MFGMRSSIQKIGLMIILIIILPVMVFSIYEIGALRQNEAVIQDIYKNQLDAILFSINQYSDDIISNLASRIENIANSNRQDKNAKLNKLVAETPAVISLMQYDSGYHCLLSMPAQNDSLLRREAGKFLGRNNSLVLRLGSYFRGGYRKVETFTLEHSDLQFVVFLTGTGDEFITNVLVLDPGKFILQTLDPKIQEVARNKFNIVAYYKGEKKPFYSSNKQESEGRIIHVRKPFWLLKNYFMGIELRDLTIADLARGRKKRNLILISLMDVILLSGAWMVFRNLKKQVELSQLKSDFVSGVSHEIRTPLALISMYIETLDMGRVSGEEKIREYYSVIMTETARLSAMVNRILSFSQIENNKKKYVLRETDLNQTIEEATLILRNTLESKGFKYALKADKTLPPLMLDKDAVSDAFVNLIDNAMKYSAYIKEINIRTGKNEKYIFVEVEDHGIGISAKNQKFIFDKFFRVTEKDLANRVKGSGLGLSIVKHIMDAHKGGIEVKSTPGTGSMFRLLFPVK
jgi:two-component system, OmpR family, phosphate regulon sensor histidine kinase PhoR